MTLCSNSAEVMLRLCKSKLEFFWFSSFNSTTGEARILVACKPSSSFTTEEVTNPVAYYQFKDAEHYVTCLNVPANVL